MRAGRPGSRLRLGRDDKAYNAKGPAPLVDDPAPRAHYSCMARHTVTAVWDAEAEVYGSRSDIVGLNVEAATRSEFVDLVEALAPELIRDNGMAPGPMTITGLAGPKASAWGDVSTLINWPAPNALIRFGMVTWLTWRNRR